MHSPRTFTVVIQSGQSLSEFVELGGRTILGLDFESGFEATFVTFQVDRLGTGDWKNLKSADDGGEVVSYAGASETFGADNSMRELNNTLPFQKRIRIRAGDSVAPVAVGSNRTIVLYTDG